MTILKILPNAGFVKNHMNFTIKKPKRKALNQDFH